MFNARARRFSVKASPVVATGRPSRTADSDAESSSSDIRGAAARGAAAIRGAARAPAPAAARGAAPARPGGARGGGGGGRVGGGFLATDDEEDEDDDAAQDEDEDEDGYDDDFDYDEDDDDHGDDGRGAGGNNTTAPRPGIAPARPLATAAASTNAAASGPGYPPQPQVQWAGPGYGYAYGYPPAGPQPQAPTPEQVQAQARYQQQFYGGGGVGGGYPQQQYYTQQQMMYYYQQQQQQLQQQQQYLSGGRGGGGSNQQSFARDASQRPPTDGTFFRPKSRRPGFSDSGTGTDTDASAELSYDDYHAGGGDAGRTRARGRRGGNESSGAESDSEWGSVAALPGTSPLAADRSGRHRDGSRVAGRGRGGEYDTATSGFDSTGMSDAESVGAAAGTPTRLAPRGTPSGYAVTPGGGLAPARPRARLHPHADDAAADARTPARSALAAAAETADYAAAAAAAAAAAVGGGGARAPLRSAHTPAPARLTAATASNGPGNNAGALTSAAALAAAAARGVATLADTTPRGPRTDTTAAAAGGGLRSAPGKLGATRSALSPTVSPGRGERKSPSGAGADAEAADAGAADGDAAADADASALDASSGGLAGNTLRFHGNEAAGVKEGPAQAVPALPPPPAPAATGSAASSSSLSSSSSSVAASASESAAASDGNSAGRRSTRRSSSAKAAAPDTPVAGPTTLAAVPATPATPATPGMVLSPGRGVESPALSPIAPAAPTPAPVSRARPPASPAVVAAEAARAAAEALRGAAPYSSSLTSTGKISGAGFGGGARAGAGAGADDYAGRSFDEDLYVPDHGADSAGADVFAAAEAAAVAAVRGTRVGTGTARAGAAGAGIGVGAGRGRKRGYRDDDYQEDDDDDEEEEDEYAGGGGGDDYDDYDEDVDTDRTLNETAYYRGQLARAGSAVKRRAAAAAIAAPTPVSVTAAAAAARALMRTGRKGALPPVPAFDATSGERSLTQSALDLSQSQPQLEKRRRGRPRREDTARRMLEELSQDGVDPAAAAAAAAAYAAGGASGRDQLKGPAMQGMPPVRDDNAMMIFVGSHLIEVEEQERLQRLERGERSPPRRSRRNRHEVLGPSLAQTHEVVPGDPLSLLLPAVTGVVTVGTGAGATQPRKPRGRSTGRPPGSKNKRQYSARSYHGEGDGDGELSTWPDAVEERSVQTTFSIIGDDLVRRPLACVATPALSRPYIFEQEVKDAPAVPLQMLGALGSPGVFSMGYLPLARGGGEKLPETSPLWEFYTVISCETGKLRLTISGQDSYLCSSAVFAVPPNSTFAVVNESETEEALLAYTFMQ